MWVGFLKPRGWAGPGPATGLRSRLEDPVPPPCTRVRGVCADPADGNLIWGCWPGKLPAVSHSRHQREANTRQRMGLICTRDGSEGRFVFAKQSESCRGFSSAQPGLIPLLSGSTRSASSGAALRVVRGRHAKSEMMPSKCWRQSTRGCMQLFVRRFGSRTTEDLCCNLTPWLKNKKKKKHFFTSDMKI